MNAKKFAALVATERKAQCVEELLTCGGDFNVTPEEAIVPDWQHVLLIAHADVAEHLRFLSGEDEAAHRKALARDLAKLVAVCERLAANLEGLQ